MFPSEDGKRPGEESISRRFSDVLYLKQDKREGEEEDPETTCRFYVSDLDDDHSSNLALLVE